MILTIVTNILYFAVISDEPSCLKFFRRDLFNKLNIQADDFSWEPEATAKVLKCGEHIMEYPIKYNPRTLSEGKKIRWEDGFIALWTLLKYRFVK